MTDGGRSLSRVGLQGVEMIALPRIGRQGRELAPLQADREISGIMNERRRTLEEAVRAFCPDLLVVEHYPFSKWELAGEIEAMLAAARSANPTVRVICSVRDIPRQTRHEKCPAAAYPAEVLARLRSGFDAVMVHAAPSLTRLEEHLSSPSGFDFPVTYTGIVSEKHLPSPEVEQKISRLTGGTPYILASVGGGADGTGLLRQAILAWRLLQKRDALPGWKLVCFPGLNTAEIGLLEHHAKDGTILAQPFSQDFLHWMQAARLSVSYAGYNTCANIMETRCRAIVVPHPAMSDQTVRANMMKKHGLAEMLAAETLDAEKLANAILHRLTSPRPEHALDLGGAEASRAYIETLVGSLNASCSQ